LWRKTGEAATSLPEQTEIMSQKAFFFKMSDFRFFAEYAVSVNPKEATPCFR